MSQSDPDKRPSCQQILQDKHLWALKENEFYFENEYKLYASSEVQEEYENFSIHWIIKSKFIQFLDRRIESISSTKEKESYIMHLLNTYGQRPSFVQFCLSCLYECILEYTDPSIYLMEIILNLMDSFPKSNGIQTIAIECLYELTKNKLNFKIYRKLIKNMIDLTLKAMESSPNNEELQRNALWLLSNDHILLNISPDQQKCIHLVMNTTVIFKQRDMNEKAIWIWSVLQTERLNSEESKTCSNNKTMEFIFDVFDTRAKHFGHISPKFF
jgi:hypothetical protein